MLSKETYNSLVTMENIERTASGIYGGFAVNEAFSEEGRKFWATMMEAELEHASLFRKIREKAAKDKTVSISIDLTHELLHKAYKKIKTLEEKILKSRVSEAKAYIVGAFLEENLYEFSYSRRIRSNDQIILNQIKKVDNDTKRHYFLLHNYSLEDKKRPPE